MEIDIRKSCQPIQLPSSFTPVFCGCCDKKKRKRESLFKNKQPISVGIWANDASNLLAGNTAKRKQSFKNQMLNSNNLRFF